MFFRNKAALAAEHARLHNNNIECHSPINRSLNNNTNNDTTSSSIQTLQPVSLSFSAPILDITSQHNQQQQLSQVSSPNPSPRAEECHFFPRIGRSNSEILLRRSTSNSNNSSSNSNNSSSNSNHTRNHSSGLNLIERMDSPNRNTKTPNLEESELANLITDDIESFSVNLQAIDTTTDENSNNNSSNSNNSSDNILYTIVIRIFHSIYTPIEHIVRTLMPSLHPQIPHFITGNTTSIGTRNSVVCQTQVSLKRAVLVLVCCITAIGVLAVTIVIFSEAVISQLGFSSTAMGATLVALGAEVCSVCYSECTIVQCMV